MHTYWRKQLGEVETYYTMEALKLHIIATVVFNLLVSARRVGINAILPYIYSHCSYFLVFCCALKYIIHPHSSKLFHWYSGNHTITSLGPEMQPRIFISQYQFKPRHSHGVFYWISYIWWNKQICFHNSDSLLIPNPWGPDGTLA